MMRNFLKKFKKQTDSLVLRSLNSVFALFYYFCKHRVNTISLGSVISSDLKKSTVLYESLAAS